MEEDADVKKLLRAHVIHVAEDGIAVGSLGFHVLRMVAVSVSQRSSAWFLAHRRYCSKRSERRSAHAAGICVKWPEIWLGGKSASFWKNGRKSVARSKVRNATCRKNGSTDRLSTENIDSESSSRCRRACSCLNKDYTVALAKIVRIFCNPIIILDEKIETE